MYKLQSHTAGTALNGQQTNKHINLLPPSQNMTTFLINALKSKLIYTIEIINIQFGTDK